MEDDAFFHFLPQAIAHNKLTTLAFDDGSSLNKWTLGAFEDLMATQDTLRVVVVPAFVILNDSAQLSVNQNTKEINVLIKRRKKLVARQSVRALTKPDLIQSVKVHVRIQKSTHTRDVYFRSGAPTSTCRQLIHRFKDGDSLHRLALTKHCSRKGALVLRPASPRPEDKGWY